MCVKVDEYENLPAMEKRLEALEESMRRKTDVSNAVFSKMGPTERVVGRTLHL